MYISMAKTNKIAEKSTITLYDRDKKIKAEEDLKLKEINGTTFNLSAFVRSCLRDKEILESYRKTDSYLNQK